jgi:hypothetical protein
MSKMNNEEVATFLKRAVLVLDEADNNYAIRRYAGIIEGALIVAGAIQVGVVFDYREIEVVNPSGFAPWFPGTKPTVMRKERYEELMTRKALEYIAACEDVPQ